MTTTIKLLPETELETPSDDARASFGALSTAQGNLPLKQMDVQARISGLLSQVELRQTFVNTLQVPVEATYVFPLPDRAAVSRFRLEVGERVVEGELQERGQARRTYDQALRQGHRAAIAEEDRSGVFSLRVGNLMPGDEATVYLTLGGPLPFSGDEATFRFPLVVAPRYVPGRTLDGEQTGLGVQLDTDAVPDASRISPPVLLPGCPNPVRLSLSVEIASDGLQLGTIRSSLHARASSCSPASASTATSCSASSWARLNGRPAWSAPPTRRSPAWARSSSPCFRPPMPSTSLAPATWCSCSTARAAWRVGRWSPRAGPRRGCWTRSPTPTASRCSPSTT
jgi:Ca-activated chloride channel family protein